jgi:hypothetical protein
MEMGTREKIKEDCSKRMNGAPPERRKRHSTCTGMNRDGLGWDGMR